MSLKLKTLAFPGHVWGLAKYPLDDEIGAALNRSKYEMG